MRNFRIFDARATADYTDEEWDALTDEERDEYESKVASQFNEVAAEADRKWEAAKVLFGL